MGISHHATRVLGIVTLVLSALALVQPARGKTEAPIKAAAAGAGHWEGKIALPGGQSFTIMVDLTPSDGNWLGTIDIPAQHAKGLTLGSITIEDADIDFQIKGVPGDPTFSGTLHDGRIEGDFVQNGVGMTFFLGRDAIEAVEAVKRPQVPEPPFPYDVREVTYPNGSLTLAGTLTTPRGDGPFPSAVLITGSGTQDRDESLMGHQPFLVLADHLTRAGIAVLRVDDRGAGGSTGDPTSATSADFADDVETSLAFLLAQPKIDAKRAGLIGHSEGGTIAPMVARRNEAVAFCVLMAGTGVPGTDLMVLQHRLIAKAAGMPPERVEKLAELQRRLLDAAVSDLPAARFREVISEIIDIQVALGPQTERPTAAALDAAKETGIAQLGSPWFRFFLRYDPRPALRATTVPVLAINGELDLQVDADQNLSAIEQALADGGNDDVTIARLPKLNHLFQTAESGSPEEYATIEETIAPRALEIMSSWILERFGAAE